jgi:thiol:disulfide interchange protein
MFRSLTALVLCAALSVSSVGAQTHAPDLLERSVPSSAAPLWGADSFTPSAKWDGQGQIQIQMAVAPGQMLYRNHLVVTAQAGWALDPVIWPAGTLKAGQAVFTQTVTAHARVRAVDSTQPLIVAVTFQGCSTEGVCHPPEHVNLTLPPASSKPTLVVLSGIWCGPCQAQAKRLADPSLRRALTHWQVVQLDVPNDDSAMETLGRYGVVGVPALRLYGAGVPVSAQGGVTLLGEQSLAHLQRALRFSSLP